MLASYDGRNRGGQQRWPLRRGSTISIEYATSASDTKTDKRFATRLKLLSGDQETHSRCSYRLAHQPDGSQCTSTRLRTRC